MSRGSMDSFFSSEEMNAIEMYKSQAESTDQTSVYIGERNATGDKEGIGVEFTQNGSIYCGHWLEGLFSGKGRLLHPNGDTYEGNWLAGKASGYGTYYHIDGTRFQG